jgi:hypothetical protein
MVLTGLVVAQPEGLVAEAHMLRHVLAVDLLALVLVDILFVEQMLLVEAGMEIMVLGALLLELLAVLAKQEMVVLMEEGEERYILPFTHLAIQEMVLVPPEQLQLLGLIYQRERQL